MIYNYYHTNDHQYPRIDMNTLLVVIRERLWIFVLLEIVVELDTDAVAIGAGVVAIVEAPNIVYTQDGEDVVQTHASLHVGFAVHRLAEDIGGEKVQVVV